MAELPDTRSVAFFLTTVRFELKIFVASELRSATIHKKKTSIYPDREKEASDR